MGGSQIKHTGVIDKIEGSSIDVRIVVESACSGCHAQGVCTTSGSGERIIKVVGNHSQFSVGEIVSVVGAIKQGFFALLMAYIIPFMLVVSTLFIGTAYAMDELKLGLLSLFILLPYYLLLYLFRNRLSQKFSFEIESQV